MRFAIATAATYACITALFAGCGAGDSHAQSTPAPPAATPAATPAAAPMTDADSASAAVAAMLELCEAGDWAGYVDTFYGEAHKFRGPADRDALVARFADRWGDQVLPALRRATTLTPSIVDDKALFVDGDEPVFELHREADGRWMFHL